MSVPTHNLYDFVHQVTKKQYLLRYFYPYGTKDLHNLINLPTPDELTVGPNLILSKDRIDKNFLSKDNLNYDSFIRMQPVILCHDQEPLNFNLYSDSSDQMKDFFKENNYLNCIPYVQDLNLRWVEPWSLQKTWILLHSELNSSELEKYQSAEHFKGAYWWSHAMLALDWYRYAEHDLSLEYTDSYDKLFLIYCRDQTGSREYRKEFMKKINDFNLTEYCQFQSIRKIYETTSYSSAEYESTDFNCTAISVVLETVFDNRIHLTEKTLRPLACGHPFILAAGPGSLNLLHQYGFDTFHPFIDESYDSITNSSERLLAIINELKRISNLPADQQRMLVSACNQIAYKNQKRFFSKDFETYISNELQTNVQAAFESYQGKLDFDTWWKKRQNYKKLKKNTSSDIGSQIALLYRKVRQGQIVQ